MKKRVLSLALVICAAAGLLAVLPVTASAETSGIYEYAVTGGEAAITGCDASASGEIVIPSMIDGYEVTGIDDYALAYCKGLTSVVIPARVTSIGERAFMYCTNLTSINVDADNASYCSADGVLFNKSKTELVQYPAGKTNDSYTIPEGVTDIWAYAFEFCESLTNVTIPEGVTDIGNGAFAYCTGLTSVVIPEGVVCVESWTFQNCTSLTSVVIPESVIGIEYGAFPGCTSLESITIPEGVTDIWGDAFAGCTGLTSVVIPGSVNT